jgi:hypothetical protein
MQSVKRELTVGAFTLALALMCGNSFLTTVHAQEPGKPPVPQTQPQPEMPDQTQAPAKSSTWTGTIVKDGDRYSLKESSGSTYRLDDSGKAQEFEGRAVKVTGELDDQAKVIHVESIEGTEG